MMLLCCWPSIAATANLDQSARPIVPETIGLCYLLSPLVVEGWLCGRRTPAKVGQNVGPIPTAATAKL